MVRIPPDWMHNGYRLVQHEIIDIRDRGELDEWDPTSISQAQIEWRIESYKQSLADSEIYYKQNGRKPGSQGKGTVSLATTASRKVVETLKSSDDLMEEVKIVARSLDANSIREIVRDPRTSYRVMRALQALPAGYGSANASKIAREMTDIDDAIIANERYLRSRGTERNKDDSGLLSLEHLDFAADKDVKSKSDNSDGSRFRTIVRKDPPKGGFEFLDAARARKINVQANAKVFAETFHRVTNDILKGLDWNNVFIAGGSILSTLLHTDPTKDDDPDVIEPDLDVYIYGLGPKEANEKVKHIYKIWSSNLPKVKQKMVVKNTKTINFLADYPNRRVQIVLKLVASPTSVLLNFDLDACALGFNGTDVLMLPRCARALETGYNVFTMDLIWGHHLGDRRASQEIRIFKYASRGFGMRMLPSYIKTIESDFEVPKSDQEIWPYSGYEIPRKPNGPEPGLKTLKRIAFLAQDTIARFYFGPTELSGKPDWDLEEGDWEEEYETLKAEVEELWQENISAKEKGEPMTGPLMDLCELDGIKAALGLPGSRRIIPCFEIWMRHCEAWRLDHEGFATLNYGSFAVNVYDPNSYDDLPSYSWSRQRPFDADAFEEAIDAHNQEIARSLESAYDWAADAGMIVTVVPNYFFPALIQRIIYGSDLDSVFDEPLTLFVEIPESLEVYLTDIVKEALEESDVETTENGHQILYPLIEPEDPEYEHTYAAYEEKVADQKILRHWKINSDLMWAGIDRRIDEVFEILWTFFHWRTQVDINTEPAYHSLSTPLRLFLRMCTKPRARESYQNAKDCYFYTGLFEFPNPRIGTIVSLLLRSYEEVDGVKYPPPDELFWNDGDEGINDGRDHEWILVEPAVDTLGSLMRKRKATLKDLR